MEEKVLFDPIRNPKEFLKAPFGRSVREQMRIYLSEIGGNMAGITLLCERYPWLLSKEDLEYLEENWMRVSNLKIRNRHD
jgi:hypothetical protein